MEAQSETRLPEPVSRRNIAEPVWMALKTSVFPGCESQSILMAWDYCAARGLDVLKKPVHIVPMKVKDSKSGNYEWRDVVMPGIGELRITAMRTGEYAGQDEPEYGPDIEHKGVTAPAWCKVTVYRLIKGHRCAFSHKEHFAEAVSTKSGGEVNSMWTKRPIGQLTKCAEAGALRKAFPEELGGQMTAEEMEGKTIDGEVVESETPNKIAKLSARLNKQQGDAA